MPTLRRLKKKISQWIDEDYSFLPKVGLEKYLSTGVAYAAGCMFPRANQEQLFAACRFFMWAFIIDDKYEYGPVEKLENIRSSALSILRGHSKDEGNLLLIPVTVFRDHLLRCSNHAWLERFTQSLDLYFDGIIREVPYRKALKFPTFPEFYEIRERAVNVFPLVNICEMITGKILPDEIVGHPVIKRIAQLTCRVLAHANDYFSVDLERNNDVWNLVLMFENIGKLSKTEALYEAVTIHNQDVAEFCRIKEDLPDFGDHNIAVGQMIENCSLMMSGYLDWTLTKTKRYDGDGHPSVDFKVK